jgi:hypothetical protein
MAIHTLSRDTVIKSHTNGVLTNSHSEHSTATHQTCIHLNESENNTIAPETKIVLIQLCSIPGSEPQESYLLLEGVGLGERDRTPAVLVAVQQPLYPLLGTVLSIEVLHLQRRTTSKVSRKTEKLSKSCCQGLNW